jgi:hypothetical protein
MGRAPPTRIIAGMPIPPIAILAAVIGLLALIPTRRLYLAGWRGWAIVGYWLLLLALGLLIAELRGPARFLVPILVVAVLAPFVTARAGIDRLLGRVRAAGARDVTPRPAPPAQLPRNVTPPASAPRNVTPPDAGAEAAPRDPPSAGAGRDAPGAGPGKPGVR